MRIFRSPTTVCSFVLILSLRVSLGAQQPDAREFYGTLEPFADEAIYFAMIDRFVDGDPSNNYEDQGGGFPTFDQKLLGPNGEEANVGYLGGDFAGIIRNLDYIGEMGFTAIWITPIMDNPDEHFSGGEPIRYGENFKDGGKTGYHGYWISNFFLEDEHYVSQGLDFEAYANELKSRGFKVVFDIVTNHGSPAFTMPVDQPKFGEIYDAEGNLVADHENLKPADLDPRNPLHAFFRRDEDILQLSNIDDENPAVMEYFVAAYLGWIEKGADAFRIDTIKHMPHRFWKQFTDAIRERHPGFFMFGESFDFDPNFLAQHTLEKNGGVSLLDFACREAMVKVFPDPDGRFADLEDYLHLTHGPYANPYDLVTFYDNHDMSRMDADTKGFINAHNWLFTTRGIPCVYYGSEMAFRAGLDQHLGNRDYFGQENVEAAKAHPIREALIRVGAVRKASVALRRGLQLNVTLEEDLAVFYRIYQRAGRNETALVVLNKGDSEEIVSINDYLQAGEWRDAESGERRILAEGNGLTTTVPADGFRVWVNNDPVSHPEMLRELSVLMAYK